ncbi:MAG: hypothetical protein JOY96_02560 [Verrucomicrobia bacterium]|nr:hypothetical protein [Verrucomicrobiota bacterium]MBV9671493.1 hypothetical protein [Verrucomicrobiota bacterium]
MTHDVNQRKAGEKWYYYGYLLAFYHDQLNSRERHLVWLEQVLYLPVDEAKFGATVQSLLAQGYRKIGFLRIRTVYNLDSFDLTRIAADKGAQIVVEGVLPIRIVRLSRWSSQENEYLCQFLGK